MTDKESGIHRINPGTARQFLSPLQDIHNFDSPRYSAATAEAGGKFDIHQGEAMRSSGAGVLVCSFMLLAGCGGGGGGNRTDSGTGGGTTTPATNVTVTITSPAINTSIAQGDPYLASISGTWSATNLGSGTLYLQVSDDAGTFTLPAIQQGAGNKAFSYSLPVASSATIGERSGAITVRACKDSTCNNLYPNGSGSVTYRLKILPVPDWETLQGNAAHNGYVPIQLDATKFAKAWEWIPPTEPGADYPYISAPVTGSNGVYVRLTTDIASSFSALEEGTGSPRWLRHLSSTLDATDPAYSAGKLYFANAYFSRTLPGLIAWDAASGANVFGSWPISDISGSQPPTLHDGRVFIQERNPTGGHLRLAAIDGTTGNPQWSQEVPEGELGTSHAIFTPAVDDNYIYYHSPCCLELLDRQSGATVARITNPAVDAAYAGDRITYTLLGNRGNALGLAYTAGRKERLLSSFNIAGRSLEWTAPLSYGAFPAVANGVIYALHAKDNQVSLHALDEATGQIRWTWSPPESEGQTAYSGNVVVTRNLVFFSTVNTSFNIDSGRVWAIDLNTHQAVWHYPAAGFLAISANRMLYISRGAPDNQPEALVAIKTN